MSEHHHNKSVMIDTRDESAREHDIVGDGLRKVGLSLMSLMEVEVTLSDSFARNST